MDRLTDSIATWPMAPVHVSLFGSAARADGNTASDIDLFVVRPEGVDDENEGWRAQLDELKVRLRRWTGNHASVVEVGELELPRLRRSRRDTIADMRTQAITLAGAPVTDVLRRR